MMELHRGRLEADDRGETATRAKHRGPRAVSTVCLGLSLCRSKSDQTGSRTGDHTGKEGSGRDCDKPCFPAQEPDLIYQQWDVI